MTNPFGELFAKAVPVMNSALIGSEGGAAFAKRYYGPVTVRHLYRFWAKEDLSDPGWSFQEGFTHPVMTRFGGFQYYEDPDVAFAAKNVLKGGADAYQAEHVAYVSIPVALALNFSGDPEKFPTGIDGDVSITSLTLGKKNQLRTAYHLMYLPSLVEATAVAMNLINERFVLPLLNDLYDANLDKDHAWDYDYQLLMCGDGVPGIFDTQLGKARASLFAALGEPDPTRYKPVGNGAKAGSASVTTATNLIEALRMATGSWAAPMWARLVFVSNPVADAFNDKGRFTVPCITHFYYNQEEAQAAADSEQPKQMATGPTIPAQWKSLGTAWPEQVKTWKGFYPNALAAWAAIGSTTGATQDELVAWWDVV